MKLFRPFFRISTLKLIRRKRGSETGVLVAEDGGRSTDDGGRRTDDRGQCLGPGFPYFVF